MTLSVSREVISKDEAPLFVCLLRLARPLQLFSISGATICCFQPVNHILDLLLCIKVRSHISAIAGRIENCIANLCSCLIEHVPYTGRKVRNCDVVQDLKNQRLEMERA
jgi:hypothetical protein